MSRIGLEVLATAIRKQVDLVKALSKIVSAKQEIHRPLNVGRDLARRVVSASEHEMEDSRARLVLVSFQDSLFQLRRFLRLRIRRFE